MQMQAQLHDFHLDYGVRGWKLPGDETVYEDPPDSWQAPRVMQRWHIEYETHEAARRVAFIKHAIVRTPKDTEAVDPILYGEQPGTSREVQAAMVPFASTIGTIQ
jgi:hypothetical protein